MCTLKQKTTTFLTNANFERRDVAEIIFLVRNVGMHGVIPVVVIMSHHVFAKRMFGDMKVRQQSLRDTDRFGSKCAQI